MYDSKTEIVANNLQDAKAKLKENLKKINDMIKKFELNPKEMSYEDYTYLMEIIYPKNIETIMELIKEKEYQQQRNKRRNRKNENN